MVGFFSDLTTTFFFFPDSTLSSAFTFLTLTGVETDLVFLDELDASANALFLSVFLALGLISFCLIDSARNFALFDALTA